MEWKIIPKQENNLNVALGQAQNVEQQQRTYKLQKHLTMYKKIQHF